MTLRILLLSTIILLFVFRANSRLKKDNQNEIHITFKLHSPDLTAESKVYITGGLPQLGNWNPAAIEMKFEGNRTWVKTITISNPTSIEYKYTLGSWEKENAGANGQPLQNFSVNIRNDTAIRDNVFFWLNGKRRVVVGQITGTVKYHTQIRGENISARDVVVWLPPGYDENKELHYPVLYMHDGQNVFDPATSAFGVDWQIDESCDSLIKRRAIQPLIVVGIYNTPARTQEYTPGDKSKEYMNFVVHKLKPFIDSAYRTIAGNKYTLTGGSSAGGTIAFMLAWEYPHIFSKVICMSPAFKIRNIDYVKKVRDYTGKRKRLLFYIDNGGIGLETQLQPGIDEMMEALNQKGYKKGKDYVWVFDPQANHSESAWAKRFPAAIKWCLRKM